MTQYEDHPCEICGEPSCGVVWDFLDVIRPQNACGAVEMRHDGEGAHFLCKAHWRDSTFTKVLEGWPWPIR